MGCRRLIGHLVMHQIHRQSSSSTGDDGDDRPGEGKKILKSDARAQGNNPRFPWQPSTTMLTYRLTGTTRAIGVLPERTNPSSSPSPTATRAGAAPHRIFANHGEPEGL